MIRISSLIFVVLFACGCAVSGVDSPKSNISKSVELKDFEPLIKEAVLQKPIDIDELGIEEYGDKDSSEFYATPQVKILELLKAYQKEHFRFNESLEKLAKNQSQKDFVRHYQIAQRTILANMLFEYYGIKADVNKRISYDEFVNFVDSFFAEQGQFITDFGEYFFAALDEMDDIYVCVGYYCGHNTERFKLADIMANLKEQNKFNDRLKNIYEYGRKAYHDYVKIQYADNGSYLWGEKLNGDNLATTKPSKKQVDDFLGAIYAGDKPKNFQNFIDFWASIYIQRLYMAKYGIEIALGSENAKSIIELNPGICTFDIYLDSNATKICEKEAFIQQNVEAFIENITNPKEKFYMLYNDKMCVIADFGVLDSEKDTSKKPKIITNVNNKSIACNVTKEALRDFQAR